MAKKYTADDKANAIRLYKEFGATKASAETGVPVNTLYNWIHEITTNSAEEGTALELKRPNVEYTKAERLEAVKLSNEIGTAKASEQTGIPLNTLYNWRRTNAAEDAPDKPAEADKVETVEAPAEEMQPRQAGYTAEERENAIMLCDKYGVAKANELTGISKKTLYKWRSEAKSAESYAAPVSGKPGRITYTAEQRAEAVRLCEELGVNEAHAQTGVGVNTLYKWISRAKNNANAEPIDSFSPDDDQVEYEIISVTPVSDIMEAAIDVVEAEEVEEVEAAIEELSNVVVSATEELVRLRTENALLKEQVAMLKNALRVFTD